MARKKVILGLDIGSYAVKAVNLTQTKSGYNLNKLGIANLPPDVVVDGEIQDKEPIVQAITALLKSQKNKVKNVSTSISGYSVIIKKISLPNTSREELAETIEVEAEQYIPFDITEVNVAFEILGQSEASEDQMDVILVAAKKDLIQSYIEIMEEAKLQPNIIDVDVFSLQNAFTASYPDKQGVIALIDIGANKLNINILKDGDSLFTRDAPMGGARITEEIQETFDLDYQTAEGIKLGGIDAPDEDKVKSIISRAIENWIAETKRAFEFLESTYPGDKLLEIYLSGGSCRFKGLDAYLRQETGVVVTYMNPFENVGFDPKKFDPEYIKYVAPQVAICLGLALRMGEEL